MAQSNFHLPLPVAIHAELKAVARERGLPATELARDLVAQGLAHMRREARRDALRAFAEAVAGTELDLDRELEAAGVESLVKGDR